MKLYAQDQLLHAIQLCQLEASTFLQDLQRMLMHLVVIEYVQGLPYRKKIIHTVYIVRVRNPKNQLQIDPPTIVGCLW